MTLRTKTLLLAALFVVAHSFTSPSAYACSCRMAHDWGFIAPQDGRLPANAAGVAWYSGVVRRPDDLPARFTVEIQEERGFRVLPVRVSPVEGFSDVYLIAPDGESLKPGATYRFTVDSVDENAGGHNQILVTIDTVPLLATTAIDLLMEPVSTESIRVSASISCFAPLLVSQVSVEAALPQSIQPWREHLLYRTVIDDGRTWHPWTNACTLVPYGRTWESVGRDRIFAGCERPPGFVEHDVWYDKGLEPGRHTVTMQAVLPGTGIILETPNRTADLSCP